MASKSIFPDEIMIEILLKLPVKSILRCNTLSKHYYSLIHSQFFIRRHLALGRLNDKLYDQSIVNPIRGPVRLFDRRGHIEVLETPPPVVEESSNVYGLVVCGPVEGLYWVIDTQIERFAVWNPSTREQFLLPRVPPTSETGENSRELGASKLMFDVGFCDRQCYAYGFGYDDTTDDYKFVLIYGFLSDMFNDLENVVPLNANTFNIFSVSKGEWRSTKEWSGVEPWYFTSFVGVFFHSACHWVYSVYSPCDGSGSTILAFDMVTELHRMITFPMVGNEYAWSSVYIVTFNNGCLGLVNAQIGDNMRGLSSSFDVWVMAEYGVTDSWTILHRVMLPDGTGGRYLGIVRDRIYIREGDGWLVSYDLYSKDQERYNVLNREVGYLIPYEESLVRIIKSV